MHKSIQFLAAIYMIFICGLANADSLLIKDINLVDPATETIFTGYDIFIDTVGKISAIGVGLSQSADATLDCTGNEYVIPGLIDLHVHANGLNGPRKGVKLPKSERVPGKHIPLDFATASYMMLYNGVTAFLDLASAQEQEVFGISQARGGVREYLSLRDAQRHYGFTGDIWQDYNRPWWLDEGDPPKSILDPPTWPYLPDIYTAGAILTPDRRHGTQYGFYTRTINTDAQAVAEVEALASKGDTDVKGVDALKIIFGQFGVPFSVGKTAVDTGHGLSEPILTIGHMTSWASADKLSDPKLVGVDAVTHSRGDAVQSSTITSMVTNGVTWIPTNAVASEHGNICSGAGPTGDFLDEPLLKQSVQNEVLQQFRDRRLQSDAETYCPSREPLTTLSQNYESLKSGGVNIVVGTDVPNRGTFNGYSVHRELILLVEWDSSSTAAADKNWYALQAATTRSSQFLADSSPYMAANNISYGVQLGDVGNLVVLNADPIADIKDTQDISDVIYRGIVVDRADLRDEFCTTGPGDDQCEDSVPASSCSLSP